MFYLCQIFINSGDDEGISSRIFDNLEESLNDDIENKIQFTKKFQSLEIRQPRRI